MTDMEDDYAGQMALADAVAPFCCCCPECSDHPCAGVMAGGLCDAIACRCDDMPDWDDDDD